MRVVANEEPKQKMEGTNDYIFPVALTGVSAMIVVFLMLKRWCWEKYDCGNDGNITSYPIVGSLPPLIKNRNRLYDWMTDELKKAPNHTVRSIMPDGVEVITTAYPPHVEHILKTNFDNYPKGEFFRMHLLDLLGNGIFNADEEYWRVQRKVSVHEFTTRSLRELVMESVRREIQKRLVPVLTNNARNRSVVDLQELFMRFGFDNICQLAFGVDPACLDPSLPDVEFAMAFDGATRLSMGRFMMMSPLIWKTMRILGLGSEKELKQAVLRVDEFADYVIAKRKKEITADAVEGNDLLTRFMMLSKQNNDSFSDSFFKDIIKSFILAGRDTTSSALTYFFWLLSKHPHVTASIRTEINSILKKRGEGAGAGEGEGGGEGGGESEGEGGSEGTSFSFEELKMMNYLHAALSESMRLYPPVPVDTKRAINDDVWPDGRKIKGGSGVGYHQYAMGRMESIWGEDCLEFKPERWLNGREQGLFMAQSPYKYAVFQAGPRVCLGKDFAYIQMKLIAAALLHEFEFVIPIDHDPMYSVSLTLRMAKGLPVTPYLKKK